MAPSCSWILPRREAAGGRGEVLAPVAGLASECAEMQLPALEAGGVEEGRPPPPVTGAQGDQLLLSLLCEQLRARLLLRLAALRAGFLRRAPPSPVLVLPRALRAEGALREETEVDGDVRETEEPPVGFDVSLKDILRPDRGRPTTYSAMCCTLHAEGSRPVGAAIGNLVMLRRCSSRQRWCLPEELNGDFARGCVLSDRFISLSSFFANAGADAMLLQLAPPRQPCERRVRS